MAGKLKSKVTEQSFDIQEFKKECTWYRGKGTKRLFDGYRILPNDPYEGESLVIEKLLKDQFTVEDALKLLDATRMRLVRAAFVHLLLMEAGESFSREELKQIPGAEDIRHYDLVLSHFIRDLSKEWLKQEVDFTEGDLCDHLRFLTYANFNSQGNSRVSGIDTIHRYNQYPHKLLMRHVARFAKKNKNHSLAQPLRDYQSSLRWHAKTREKKEKALAQDLIKKVDALL